jgi:hypothetical protein
MHLQGKARKPYEFGVKVSLTITHQHGLMVGAQLPQQPLRRPYAGRATGAEMAFAPRSSISNSSSVHTSMAYGDASLMPPPPVATTSGTSPETAQ